MNDDIIMLVSGWEGLQEDLSSMPHRKYADLTLCYFSMRQGKSGNLIELKTIDNREAMRRGFVNEESLYKTAAANTEEKFPLLISDWGDDISVVTNQRNVFGATSIFYPGCLEEVSDRVGGDMFIIPSSIHEVLCLPYDSADPKDLRKMLYQANNEVVPEQDVLSYNIYQYSAKSRQLTACASGD